MTDAIPTEQPLPREGRVPRRRRMDGKPRWKVLYDAMAELGPDELITYEDMARLLDLEPGTPRTKSVIYGVSRKALQELEAHENLVFTIVRGKGYTRAEPTSVIVMAHKHQERALAEIHAGVQKAATIDTTAVGNDVAALARATVDALSRQAVAMTQLDVRQRRLGLALESLDSQVHTHNHRIQALEQRVNQIGWSPQAVPPASAPPAAREQSQLPPQHVPPPQPQLPAAAAHREPPPRAVTQLPPPPVYGMGSPFVYASPDHAPDPSP